MDIKTSDKFPRNIAPELLEAWNKLRRFGDGKLMADELEYSRPVIDRALNFGHVNVNGLTEVISNWFVDRLKRERASAEEILSENNLNEHVKND